MSKIKFRERFPQSGGHILPEVAKMRHFLRAFASQRENLHSSLGGTSCGEVEESHKGDYWNLEYIGMIGDTYVGAEFGRPDRVNEIIAGSITSESGLEC